MFIGTKKLTQDLDYNENRYQNTRLIHFNKIDTVCVLDPFQCYLLKLKYFS